MYVCLWDEWHPFLLIEVTLYLSVSKGMDAQWSVAALS